MTDKKKVTDASAVELDETDLDQAQGGGTYDFAFKTMDVTGTTDSAGFLKLGDIDGEPKLTADYLKIGDISGAKTRR